MTYTTLGYKIFDTLQAFYTWQGEDDHPVSGTVNYALGYSIDSVSGTFRYTYPHPHPGAISVIKDDNGMPTSISGADLRVCCSITEECPVALRPAGLVTFDDVKSQGWFTDIGI